MTEEKILLNNKHKVVVGMSGGVDSAVAAWLLKNQGFDTVGVTLRTWESGSNRCCEIDEARRSAQKLGIPYYPWNAVKEFREYVTKPFAAEYVAGRTPNPCVECNRYVKWDMLLHIADVLQADYVASGHYASVVRADNGRLAIRRATDTRKDQSYMLCRLTQEQLARTILPLGELTKQQVRQIAADTGIVVADKAESQEICFVTEGNYADYIEQECGAKIFAAGNFTDETGKIVGRHKGIACYTVGQRKGLGLALGYPVYVKRIDAAKNEIIVGREASLYTDEIFCGSLSFMGIADLAIGEKIAALVKIRYAHGGEHAVVERLNQETARIVFAEAVRAPAPGQSAVFYDETGSIIGSGKILTAGFSR